MARRTAFLCIGLPGALGSRTTADLLAGHADTLAVAGHHIPADAATTRRATWEITRDTAAYEAAGLTRRDVEGTWDGVWRRAYRERRPRNVVLAEERFARADTDQVALCLDALSGFRVHVVVMAADPADLLARSWTDAVRRGRPMPLLPFADRRDEAIGPDADRARRWWRSHDLPAVLDRWSAHVPADRIHVVALGGDDASRAERAGAALGGLLDTGALAAPYVEEAPVVDAPRALPSTVLATLRAEAVGWADALRASSYDVHGDVDALVPRLPGPAEPTLADLSPDARLHLAGDALADALVQIEGLRRENADLRTRTPQPRRARHRRGHLFTRRTVAG